MRPRGRDVTRPRGRDARGRRCDRGTDGARCHQRDPAQRRAGSTARGSPVADRSLHRGRLRPGGRARGRDAGPRNLRLEPQPPVHLGLQHQLRDVRVRGARLHLAGPDIRIASRRHRSVRRPACRLSRRSRIVLHPRRPLTRGVGAGVRPDASERHRSRAAERRAHPLREVHGRSRRRSSPTSASAAWRSRCAPRRTATSQRP